MTRRICTLLLAATLAISACGAETSVEDALLAQRDDWARYAMELEDELIRLNWEVCAALWDWAYSVDPTWADERSARFVRNLEDEFRYWLEDSGRIQSGPHEGQEFYDGFCYWG